jgi:acyl-CoA dehydrogenase
VTETLLLETAEKAFASTSTFAAVRASEAEHWAPAVWDAAVSIGLPWISVPEEAGGAGGSLSDAISVLCVAGRHAAPIPLAETGLLAGWLLSSSGLPVGTTALTVVPGSPRDDLRIDGGRLSGTAHRVPWAASVGGIVALVAGHVVCVRPDSARIEFSANLAGEPRESVTFESAPVELDAPAGPGVDEDALHFRGALARAALMAGALGAMTELTVAYTSERRQFGQAVGRFQAVQALLVRCAEEAALVDLAVQVAARETERGGGRFEVASAKLLANEAAGVATRASHQAHGAMGMTQEYPLHHLSRRLWSWRNEYGGAGWAKRIGRAVAAVGPDSLYRIVSEGTASGVTV